MNEQMKIREEVYDLLKKLPLRGAKRFPEGANPEHLDSLERSLGFCLPEEYRNWLIMSNGPPVVPGGMAGIEKKTATNDILKLMEIYPIWKANRYLPITGDGFGNDYVLAVGHQYGKWNPVLFIESQEGAESPTYIVASDLWLFLKGFFLMELGEDGWPFDQEKTLLFDPDISKVPNIKLPWS